MALSPDGRRLLVSASTARTIDVLDTADGRIVGRIPSGDAPHESNFSRDGSRSSTPASAPSTPTRMTRPRTRPRASASSRSSTRARSGSRADRHGPEARRGRSPGHELRGTPDGALAWTSGSSTSSSPSSTASSSTTSADRVTRVAALPLSDEARPCRGSSTCSTRPTTGWRSTQGHEAVRAGTMSDYAAIVARRTLRLQRTVAGRRDAVLVGLERRRPLLLRLGGR